MPSRIGRFAAACSAALLLTMLFWPDFGVQRQDPEQPGVTAIVGAEKLRKVYGRWASHRDAAQQRDISILLAKPDHALGTRRNVEGRARIDLDQRELTVEVRGIPQGGRFDVWIADRRASADARSPLGDGVAGLRVGTLQWQDGIARLSAALRPEFLDEWRIDRIMIAPSGSRPEPVVLEGSPSLFQKQYASTRVMRREGTFDTAAQAAGGWSFGASVAQASGARPTGAELERLIEKGRRLFTEETFRGNGRTCATCHPLHRNTTLGVNDVAALPDGDPLFVAEFSPALAFQVDGPKFEVPPLLRGAALILENLDGFEDLSKKFVMRSINHLLAISTALEPEPTDGLPNPPVQRTGWSGDGAPGDGALRGFATGAVIQHFTRTLERVPGRDFRLPTDDELDALEAFQLSLGRSQEEVFPKPFRDPIILRGQQIFGTVSNQGGGNCSLCHFRAGARVQLSPGEEGGNRNFATGVEDQPDLPGELILRSLGMDLAPDSPRRFLPPDGGFGADGDPNDPTGDAGTKGSLERGFGDSSFNTAVLIEAADTPPFFHNNSIRTIEGAVAFYNSEAFNRSFNGSVPILQTHMEATQVEAVAAFLRALNALENIRQTREIVTGILGSRTARRQEIESLLKQAASEVEDAIKVLAQQELQPEVVAILQRTKRRLQAAQDGKGIRSMGEEIVALLDLARAGILEE